MIGEEISYKFQVLQNLCQTTEIASCHHNVIIFDSFMYLDTVSTQSFEGSPVPKTPRCPLLLSPLLPLPFPLPQQLSLSDLVTSMPVSI